MPLLLLYKIAFAACCWIHLGDAAAAVIFSLLISGLVRALDQRIVGALCIVLASLSA